MRRIARWLDRHARLIDAGRQHAGGNQIIVRAPNAIEHFGEDVMDDHEKIDVAAPCWSAARLTQFRGRVKKPRVLRQRIAVGHAGDEIGDAAGADRLVGAGKSLSPFSR